MRLLKAYVHPGQSIPNVVETTRGRGSTVTMVIAIGWWGRWPSNPLRSVHPSS